MSLPIPSQPRQIEALRNALKERSAILANCLQSSAFRALAQGQQAAIMQEIADIALWLAWAQSIPAS